MPYVSKPTSINEIWASGGITSQPTNLKISQGWTVEIPPYQFFNWSQNRTDAFTAHINQMGIPVWDNATEYQINKSHVQGSDGNIYKAKTTNTDKDPTNVLNSSHWGLAFDIYGSSVVVQDALNTHLSNYSTLAGIANTPQARTNLSVYSKSEGDARYAYKAGASGQTFSVANATLDEHAINRGQFNALLNTATETQAGILEVADQSEMNVGTRDDRAVTPKKGKDTYLMRSNNLSDLGNLSTAKTTLGIKDVGTTVGTVAAGDDSRITNAVPNSRIVGAGNGLTGGGYLWSDAVISMGTPSTVGSYSSNWTSETSHSHSFDITSFFNNRQLATNGWYTLPGNFVVQWGTIVRGDITHVTNFQINLHFPMNIFQAFAISRDTSQAVSFAVGGFQTTHFQAQAWERDGAVQGGYIGWFAIGVPV